MAQLILQDHRRFSSLVFPITLALVAGIVFTVFPLLSDGHFLSPDETANAAFARQFAASGHLTIPEPLNELAHGIVHPRSMVADGTAMVPVSFVFYPFVLGLIMKFLGTISLAVVPVILFSGSILAFWLVVRTHFGRSSSVLSTAMYALHPVIFFYSARGLWQNGSFISLFVLALGFLLGTRQRLSLGHVILGLFFFAMAVAVRLNELPWIAFVAVVLLQMRRPLPRHWLWGILGIFVIFTGTLTMLQHDTFGSFWRVGYSTSVGGASTGEPDSLVVRNQVRSVFFPFGIHILPSVRLWFQYSWTFAGPLFFLGLLGLASVLWKRSPDDRAKRRLAGAAIIVALWLIFYYGSFAFTESFNQQEIVLGSSYLRYWLPIYVLFTLFVGEGVLVLRRVGVPRIIVGGLVAMAVVSSLYFSFADPLYGTIKATQSDLKNGQAQRAAALPVIPENAIVYAGPSDKVFYPERKVIGYTRLSQRETSQLQPLSETGLPIFFITGNRDELTLAQQAAESFRHAFTRRLRLPGGDGLYELVPSPSL